MRILDQGRPLAIGLVDPGGDRRDEVDVGGPLEPLCVGVDQDPQRLAGDGAGLQAGVGHGMDPGSELVDVGVELLRRDVEQRRQRGCLVEVGGGVEPVGPLDDERRLVEHVELDAPQLVEPVDEFAVPVQRRKVAGERRRAGGHHTPPSRTSMSIERSTTVSPGPTGCAPTPSASWKNRSADSVVTEVSLRMIW